MTSRFSCFNDKFQVLLWISLVTIVDSTPKGPKMSRYLIFVVIYPKIFLIFQPEWTLNGTRVHRFSVFDPVLYRAEQCEGVVLVSDGSRLPPHSLCFSPIHSCSPPLLPNSVNIYFILACACKVAVKICISKLFLCRGWFWQEVRTGAGGGFHDTKAAATQGNERKVEKTYKNGTLPTLGRDFFSFFTTGPAWVGFICQF